ncbi:MAG: ABC transporter permease, partial [Acidobacteriota bacterium]|nr:ABC transporter permease [Acidobacteriota bacterium]
MHASRAVVLLGILATIAIAAPWAAPYDPSASFRGYRHAPPMPPRVSKGLMVHPVTLESMLEERFAEDRTRTVPLPWSRRRSDPVFLLGADRSGRDVLSRLLAGARVSLGLGLVSVLGATLLGSVLGAGAGAAGGRLDDSVMRAADFVVVLPVLYVVLVLRAAMPLVLPSAVIFALMAGIFVAVGWPVVARGVRGIVARERDREYVLAARSLGAGHGRVLVRHLLPACAGHVAVQASLLLPAFVLAEAALSYAGLGFPDTTPSWGTMLHDAADINELTRFPWVLAP